MEEEEIWASHGRGRLKYQESIETRADGGLQIREE